MEINNYSSDGIQDVPLTGIERDLVVRYLCDANVPLTVMVAEENETASRTALFSVALSSDDRRVLDQGIILLKDSVQSVKEFMNRKIRVQFYFNQMGLYFDSVLKQVSSGCAIVIPKSISRLKDNFVPDSSGFKVQLFYETSYGSKNNEDGSVSLVPETPVSVNAECTGLSGYHVTSQPKWSDIREEKQSEAKDFLEKIVFENRNESGNIKNGVHLISVSRYLTEDADGFPSVLTRENFPFVVFIDHQRLVFASREKDMIFNAEKEYALKIVFPLEAKGPIKFRDILVSGIVERIYRNDKDDRICLSLRYTSIKQEDMRFLYEKTKNELLE